MEEKCCYHCSSPEHFNHGLSKSEGLKGQCSVKLQGGDGIKEGSLSPSDESSNAQEPQGGGSHGITRPKQTPFLNLDPFQHWHGALCIVNVRKEREIDAFAMPWANARVAHLLSVCTAMTTMVDDEATETASSNGYNEVVFRRNTETIHTFSSHVLPAKADKAYMGEHINIMTQALQITDGSLPPRSYHPECIHRVMKR